MSDYDLKYKNKYLKYKNKYLDLKNQTGGNFFTQFLPPSFLNVFLKDTILTYNNINDREALQIAKLMEINTTATTLNLTNSILDDEVYRILGESLKKNKTLKTLNLTNSIKMGQLEYLTNSLKENTTLQTLNLTDNALSDVGANKIIDLLKINEIITNIIIDNTDIKRVDKKDMLNMLDNNKFKKFKKFIDTFDNKTLEEITNFLNDYTILDLTKTTISDKGFANLSDALKTNTTLITLKIGSNKIQDKDIFLFNLFSALKINKTLTTLDLVDMELEDIDAEIINSLLGFNTTLKILNLLNNKFTKKGKNEFNSVKNKITINY